MTPAEQLKESVLSLQNQLLAANPAMPQLLRAIHTQLRADPALVTTMDEADIGILVQGLSKQQSTIIATSIAKSKTKSIKSLGIGDL